MILINQINYFKLVNCVAIIPARGGSKGIPLKNLQKVGGLPLVVRTIKAALSSNFINAVYVSSDSDEILMQAFLNGAVAIKRPEELADDQSSTDPVLIHALEKIEENTKYDIDYIVLLQCTSAFTTSIEIDKTIDKLIKNDIHDAAFAVSESHSFLWSYDSNLKQTKPVNHDFPKSRKRRQDLNKTYKELGSVYVINKQSFKIHKNRFGKNPIPVLVDSLNSFLEIDDIKDLNIARQIFNFEQNNFIGKDFIEKVLKIKLFIMDFDGVFTDNMVGTLQSGEEFVLCSKFDSLGLAMLKKLNIKLIILTSEKNESVYKRAKKLNIECIYSVFSKKEMINNLMLEFNLNKENIAFMGNDINDICAAKSVSLFFCPNDSHERIKEIADYSTKLSGGHGAIREVCDLFLQFKTNVI